MTVINTLERTNLSTLAMWYLTCSELPEKRGYEKLIGLLHKEFPNVQPENTPWCSYFVASVLSACNLPFLHTGRAKDWESFGLLTYKPVVMDLIITKNFRNGKEQNHVGFFVKEDDVNYTILSGNWANSVAFGQVPKITVSAIRQPIRKALAPAIV